MARCSCGLDKDPRTGMCPSCDSADRIEVSANKELNDLTSGQLKVSPAFNEKRIERAAKKAARKSKRAVRARNRQGRAAPGMVTFNWLLVLIVTSGVVYFVAFPPSIDWESALPTVGSEEEPLPAETEEAVVPEAELERLLPQVYPSESGPYEPLRELISGDPSYFDPCRVIHWVVNPANEPEGARELLLAAFEEIQLRTGLLFVFAGETDEEYDWLRDPRNDSYPEVDSDWKPVIVWYLPEEQFQSSLAKLPEEGYEVEEVAGFASPDYTYSTGESQRLVSVSGTVVMDATWSEYIVDEGLPEELWWTLTHEIGHVMGLDHVDDADHLMFGGNDGYRESLGPGDIEGLAVAGSNPCLKESEYPRKSDWIPYDTTSTSTQETSGVPSRLNDSLALAWA